MRQETVNIYHFAELSDSAKENARAWYRQYLDYDWWDCLYEDAKTIAGLMGIEIENIYFSGFSSQGDGACFTGYYSYKKGGAKAVKGYAPADTTLHQIASDLQDVQRAAFYRLTAQVTHSGHYSHENCTEIPVCRDGDYATNEQEHAVKDALRDFMRWIYRQIESEYEYLMSDESVDESIEANEYEFHEDGTRA